MFSDLALLGFGPQGWGGLLLQATLTTLTVTLAALAVGAVIGVAVCWAKLSTVPVARAVGEAYTTVFRGVPELLIIYFVYFGGSALVTQLGQAFGGGGFLGLPSFLAGCLAVGLISAAYQAEVFRGAYHSVARGEIEAARACGMGAWLRLRRVIGPQVLRFAIPGLGNVWQLSLKDSALVSVTGLAEILRTTQVGANSTHRTFLFFVAGLALYLVLTSVSGRVFDTAEHRSARRFRRA